MSHQLETIIGYKFKNPELLETALTHTSYANESRHRRSSTTSGWSFWATACCRSSRQTLFHAYADRPEGDLTRIRSSLVSEGALFQFAQEIDLGDYLRLGRGEEHCGGRTRPSVVSDAFEALIAALTSTAAWRWQRTSSCPSSPRASTPRPTTRPACRRSSSRTPKRS